ncbi:MAG: hypothetical protein AAF202_13335, partial [Pseudomonadota bacterium]
ATHTAEQAAAMSEGQRLMVIGLDLDPHHMLLKTLVVLLAATTSGIEIDEQFFRHPIDDPQNLHEKNLYSLSYIGPYSAKTYRPVGFIVDVPPENIVRTYFEDSGSPVYADYRFDPSELEGQVPLGPDELLKSTYAYNEINALGSHPETGSRIRAVGVFIRMGPRGEQLVSDEERRWWVDYSKRQGWPEPILIKHQFEPHSSNSAVALWRVAHQIVDQHKPIRAAQAPQISAWEDEIGSSMSEWGNQSNELRRRLWSALQVVQSEPGVYGLKISAGLMPPESLLFPQDPAMSFLESSRYRVEQSETSGDLTGVLQMFLQRAGDN